MTGLKNSKNSFKRLCILFLFSTTNICWAQESNQKEQNFLNSKTYQTSLEHYKKDEKILADKRFFMRIGEEPFLYDNTYDLFSIYLYQPLKAKTIDLYVLKSKNGVSTISHKEFEADQFYYYSENAKELIVPQNSTTYLKFIDSAEIVSFKSGMSNIITKKRDKKEMSDYDSPLRTLWYFDGSHYSLLTDYYVGPTDMEKVKAILQKMTGK